MPSQGPWLKSSHQRLTILGYRYVSGLPIWFTQTALVAAEVQVTVRHLVNRHA